MKKIIIIATIGFFASCSQNEASTEHAHNDEHAEELALTSEQLNVNDYKLGKPVLHSFSQTVSVTGVIDLPPSHRHVISNYMTGYIKKINVIVGDRVKKGQVLAIIEHQGILVLQERYIKAESQKEYLEQEYERLKKLFEENVVSKKEFISSKSKYHSIEAEANSLKQQLLLINLSPKKIKSGEISSSYTVRAPADGIISSVNATTGEWVGNEKQLMSLVNPEHIHLELQVFAKDIPLLSEGQSLNFGLHGNSEHNYKAKIYRIGAEVKEDRRVLIHAHPDSAPDHMTIGAYVNGSINVTADSLFALPITAISTLNGENYVLIENDHHEGETHFKRTKINVIKQQNGWIAIDKKWKNSSFLLNGVFDLIKDENSASGHKH
jgi:cobalt-zinc-cadmium efflux system membrane fusion protein